MSVSFQPELKRSLPPAARSDQFAIPLDATRLYTGSLSRHDYPGVSSGRGVVAFINVPVSRLAPPPRGYDYVTNGGAALVVVDSFLNVNGRANLDNFKIPGLGWFQEAVNAVGSTLYGNYPEVMPTVLVRSQRDGRYCQYTPEMHVDAKSGSMGITLDRTLGFGFNKQPSTIRTNAQGSRFDVTCPRGSYSVEPIASGPIPSAVDAAFWDTMKSRVPTLGSRQGAQPRSLFNRALPSSWDAYGEPTGQTATAVCIRGDGLRHLGIEPGVYPGFRYQRFHGLTFPRA